MLQGGNLSSPSVTIDYYFAASSMEYIFIFYSVQVYFEDGNLKLKIFPFKQFPMMLLFFKNILIICKYRMLQV